MYQARRLEYVRLIVEEGLNYTQAARRVGVSKRTGKVWRNGRTRATGRNEHASVHVSARWYRQHMLPIEQINVRYLSQSERLSIADRLRLGDSIRTIARILNRSASTISREIRKNTNPVTHRYEPYKAHEISSLRRRRPKPLKIETNPLLWEEIFVRLRKHYSPEQISHDLSACFPDNKRMQASHETIYQSIYVQAKGELKQELLCCMREHKVKRVARTSPIQRTPRFREPMVLISQRPASIEDRAIPGHWEGDLICGAHNKSAIGTLVERTTRFTILLYLPHDHSALTVQQAIIRKMRNLPCFLRNSLTWDQGSELALHSQISASLNMDVYFCDPHSPWQRGTNENTNRLLRQYFPKGTDLSIYPEDYLDTVAEELNDRPRKTLGWKRPSEKILELIQENEKRTSMIN